ncbi:MAG: RtcB family protein, partial [Candidatus Omnitrophica bacterium]|nr:RtcB family protein [Candidatus Omnitrophota bacterium]
MNNNITGSFDNRVKTFLNEEIDFTTVSKNKIEKILLLDDILEIIILPDVHSKPDNPFPTGIVTLTSNTIYPFAIGQEIGCGIRLLKTSLDIQDINKKFLDNYFTCLKDYLRDGRKKVTLFTKEEYLNILFKGYEWGVEKFDTERHCSIDVTMSYLPFKFCVKDILSAIPKDAFIAGYQRLGTLGGGNHFLEFQSISEILDRNACDKFGLQKGKILILFHTGANVFAKRFDNYYGVRFQKHGWDKILRKNFRKFLYHFNDFRLWRFLHRLNLFFSKDFKGIYADSLEGRKYLLGFYAAMNYGFVNRTIISQFVY